MKRLLLFLIVTLTAQAEPLEVLTYLRPVRSIELSAREDGVIQEILVKPGQEVKKGQALVVLDTDVLEAQLAEAKAQAAQDGKIMGAEATRDLAAERVTVLEDLASRGTANSVELDRGRSNLKIAQGALNATLQERELFQLQVRRIEVEIARRTLLSPIDGTVTDVMKDVAENVTVVQPGEEPWLVRVVDLHELKATAHVPFEHCRDLKVGDSLQVRVDDQARTLAQGVIQYISPLVNPATGAREIHLIFANPDRKLLSGVPARLLVPTPRP